MQAPAPPCGARAFRYNGTQCACDPGYMYNHTAGGACTLFAVKGPALGLSNGVDYDTSLAFPATIFEFDSIKKFTQSQAVFLEATAVMLLCWLGFCLLLRFFPLGDDGRSATFRIRWWISRLDISFAMRHWLNDQRTVVKRKTELGGTFSIASWILFIGLFAALLYQIISKRSIEVHNVRASNEPDLVSFLNDLQFNVTTISSMSCAQLRGLGTLVTGNPAFIDYRVVPLSTFANYSCVNTSMGPTITLQCNDCRLSRDNAYVSWQFIDLPNNPATAVGFQFILTAKNRAQERHLSYVSGIVKNASNFDNRPITYRGALPNVLKFNLFPRIFHNLRELKLIQPLFHEFLPGSYFGDVSQLQQSLQSSNNGLVNTTVCINFLSSYIVEIENQSILGPVSFLADLGGLYCISIGIFFYLLVQCEYRIKRLRNEDSIMRSIRSRRKAQERWEKLRKYVRYTWGSCSLDDNYRSESTEVGCSGVMMKSLHQSGSSRRRRPQKTVDAVSFSKNIALPSEKKAVPEAPHMQEVRSHLSESTSNRENRSSFFENRTEDTRNGDAENRKNEPTLGSPHRAADIADLPPLPPFELGDSAEMSMTDLQKNLQKLYEYNVKLREKLIAAQSKGHVSGGKESSSTVQ